MRFICVEEELPADPEILCLVCLDDDSPAVCYCDAHKDWRVAANEEYVSVVFPGRFVSMWRPLGKGPPGVDWGQEWFTGPLVPARTFTDMEVEAARAVLDRYLPDRIRSAATDDQREQASKIVKKGTEEGWNDARICDGCRVRGTWEHRCYDPEVCDCELCREVEEMGRLLGAPKTPSQGGAT